MTREERLLRQKRAAHLDNALSICRGAEAASRDLTDAEAKDVARLRSKAASLLTQIELTSEAAGVTRSDSFSVGDMLGGSGMGSADRACGPFENFGEFLQVVRAAALQPSRADARLYDTMITRAAGASGAVPSDGGFLVSTDFSQDILSKVHQTGQLNRLVRHIPIGVNANGIKINAIDESSRATGSRFGAIRTYWVSEAGSLTGSRPKFRQIQMDLQKLAGLFYATDELMQDATALSAEAERAFIEEFGFVFDDLVLNGTGAGQPLGILNSPALVTVAKESSQAANTVVIQNITKMWSRLAAGSEGRAVWLVNKDVLPQLFTLSLTIGTAGVPVFMPAGGVSGQPYNTLMGRPVMTCEQCSTLGTAGDIILFDPQQYLWIEKGGVQSASSIHVQFLTDEMVFRWIVRVNGQPWWNLPETPYKGANTVSPYVTLETRA